MSGNDQIKVQSSCSSNLVTITLSSDSSPPTVQSAATTVSSSSQPKKSSSSGSKLTNTSSKKRPSSALTAAGDAHRSPPSHRLSKQHMLDIASTDLLSDPTVQAIIAGCYLDSTASALSDLRPTRRRARGHHQSSDTEEDDEEAAATAIDSLTANGAEVNEKTPQEGADQEEMGPPSKRHKVGTSLSGGGDFADGLSPIGSGPGVIGSNSNSSKSQCGPSMEMYGGNNRISVIGHDNGNGNDFDEEEPRMSSVEARFLVSSRDAGAIIGRGGSNITHLRQTYDSSITVPDCPSPERVLTVVANIERIAKIVREVLKYIETRPHALGTAPGRFESMTGQGKNVNKLGSRNLVGLGSSSSSSGFNATELKDKSSATEIRLLLHTSHAGGLIGKSGLRITQLREETHAGIKVYSECAPQSSERVCVIYGPLEVVVQAVKSVLYLISGFPVKGPNMLYDPRHYDQYLSPMYGGFSDPATAPPAGMPPSGALSQVAPPPQSSNQRNPYFQPPPPPGLGPDGLGSIPPGQRRGGNSTHNSFSLSGSSGSRGGGYGNNGHHQSGLLSPLNGPRGFKSSSLMEPDSSDLFTPDFGGTFSSANIPWSSARSYTSSRRSSTSGTSAGGVDVFSPLGGGDIDWLNYPGAAAKSWNNNASAASQNTNSSILLQQLLTRDDVDIISNVDGSACATISVPNKSVGAIIGRRGCRISEIRVKSHAEISIGPNQPKSPTRTITVKGILATVQAACFMICKLMDENM